MYRPVSHPAIRDALIHLRDLYGESAPKTEGERREQQAREIFVRNLLSNLAHMHPHPMLHMVMELADRFRITLDGAHQLFGYNLAKFLGTTFG